MGRSERIEMGRLGFGPTGGRDSISPFEFFQNWLNDSRIFVLSKQIPKFIKFL